MRDRNLGANNWGRAARKTLPRAGWKASLTHGAFGPEPPCAAGGRSANFAKRALACLGSNDEPMLWNPNLPCDFGERGPLQPLTFDGFEGSPEQLLVAESSNMRSGHDIGARLLD